MWLGGMCFHLKCARLPLASLNEQRRLMCYIGTVLCARTGIYCRPPSGNFGPPLSRPDPGTRGIWVGANIFAFGGLKKGGGTPQNHYHVITARGAIGQSRGWDSKLFCLEARSLVGGAFSAISALEIGNKIYNNEIEKRLQAPK